MASVQVGYKKSSSLQVGYKNHHLLIRTTVMQT